MLEVICNLGLPQQPLPSCEEHIIGHCTGKSEPHLMVHIHKPDPSKEHGVLVSLCPKIRHEHGDSLPVLPVSDLECYCYTQDRYGSKLA
jgi:hypothetical protein